jgi:hypothetical protein
MHIVCSCALCTSDAMTGAFCSFNAKSFGVKGKKNRGTATRPLLLLDNSQKTVGTCTLSLVMSCQVTSIDASIFRAHSPMHFGPRKILALSCKLFSIHPLIFTPIRSNKCELMKNNNFITSISKLEINLMRLIVS